ncbi:cadmium-translocating P-type ATPase [Loktanella sp. D2R18]|uniref:heavy metal translocating P-type ATPase n=1 Tax=Rhodobacterales TaxID=204455 RepID=UPI000DE81D78|nr:MULTISPECIES: heavy metal translocating P-type ATPase [Rhodobacterales]MDO6590072.1 heavy metal translocating P-type ATPase [Yoonia sp. 1_MG-2023]RBW45803.1 cadmium-translocating P-type ATPase [Loktanella sp. D2R18]
MTQAAACPACIGLPEGTLEKAASNGSSEILLSLPAIHCVACINGVERALRGMDGVANARVNLSMKRVTVGLDAPIAAEALIDTLELAGFEARVLDTSLLGAESDSYGSGLMTRIAVSGFAMMNVMLLSVAIWSGAVGATQHMFHMISAMIALPALIYAAQPFFHNAWTALSVRKLNMDVPISLAIILAAGMSLFETFVGGAQAYFDAALSLTFFLLIGRYLDHRSRKAAASAAAQLSALEVPRVMRLRDDTREMVDFATLEVGDLIQVLPGGRIPVDGVVTEGSSQIDRSLLTGESRTAEANPDTDVTAGEVNMTGPLTIRATTVGADTTLRKMVTMVDQAEAVRNRYTAIADRAAAIYAPVVHLLALAAFLGWVFYSGDVRLSLNIAVAVLIITCPCALGLAVPAVSTTAAGRLFRAGLLVKDGTALERLAEVDTVVFDKTGTLTMPAAARDTLDARAQSIALALTKNSTHPVAQAIAASLDGVTPEIITDQEELSGRGLRAQCDGQLVRLGSGAWLGAKAGTYLQIGDAPAQKIALRSELREGAAQLISGWQDAGLDVHLVSGDDADETAKIAGTLGVKNWQAQTKPAEKIAYITALSENGAKVLMVGDGLNDTGALAAAYASVSPATAADASRAASDIVLLNDSLTPLIELPKVARAAKRRILENFAISASYNAIAIPIALLGFATPLLAAIAMSSSSITVLLNALRLRGRV